MAQIDKKDLRIQGRQTLLVPFSNEHLNDPDYIGWLHDPEIIKTLNLPHYLLAPVSR